MRIRIMHADTSPNRLLVRTIRADLANGAEPQSLMADSELAPGECHIYHVHAGSALLITEEPFMHAAIANG